MHICVFRFNKLALISENATLYFKVLSNAKARLKDFENATKNLTCKLALKSDEINMHAYTRVAENGEVFVQNLEKGKNKF
jgi:hypothetical protein